jgi:Flp pilus assembly protein TadG
MLRSILRPSVGHMRTDCSRTDRTRAHRYRVCNRRRGEHGAAIVEAALITPLFLLIIFGILEVGVAVMSWNAAHGASREAARQASVAGSVEFADHSVLKEVKSRLNSPTSDLLYVIVFKANDAQSEPSAACLASAKSGGNGVSDPTAPCNVYRKADYTVAETMFSAGLSTDKDVHWRAIDRVDWINGPVDHVGVTVFAKHNSLLGIIPSVTLRYTTVFAIEAATEEG